MSTKTVLHLYPYLNTSCGVTNSIKLIVKNSLNYNHCILTFGGNAVNNFDKLCPVFNFERVYKVSLWAFLTDTARLIRICRSQKVDILHSHHRYFDLVSFVSSKFIRTKTITTVRSIVKGMKYFSYKSRTLIAVSNFVKDHLVDYFGKEDQNINVINNFFDEREAIIDKPSIEIRNELNLGKETLVFGSFGRIDFDEKSTDKLIEIFIRLTNLEQNVTLLLIGDGKDFEKAKILIGNSTNIILKSGQKNIHNYYNILNYYILPSVNEPFGNVLLEAGFHKIPIIANDCGGIPEILKNNGILFRKNDFVDLENIILKMVNEKIDSFMGVERFHKRILLEFSIKSKIYELEKLYDSK